MKKVLIFMPMCLALSLSAMQQSSVGAVNEFNRTVGAFIGDIRACLPVQTLDFKERRALLKKCLALANYMLSLHMTSDKHLNDMMIETIPAMIQTVQHVHEHVVSLPGRDGSPDQKLARTLALLVNRMKSKRCSFLCEINGENRPERVRGGRDNFLRELGAAAPSDDDNV